MIDIHCHILPRLDDGSPGLEQSLAMARIAVADGIKEIVCTPHWAPGTFKNSRLIVLGAVAELQERLDESGVPLKLIPGAELRLDPDLPAKIDAGEILTLNDSGRFALIELPDIFLTRNLEIFFWNLISRGVTPVICHPERNGSLLRDPMPLFRWVEMGALLQVTGSAITGGFGPEVRRFARFLLKYRLAHVLATDAHDTRMRAPALSRAVAEATEILGRKTALRMVSEIPGRILSGERVTPPSPLPLVKCRDTASISRKIFSFLRIASTRPL
ncbi:MAG: hypothetical protein LLG06_03655 [Desulfobacteraceae bacterium]|nr:hypothetical protein [Desulfobacteraceae bacterium]